MTESVKERNRESLQYKERDVEINLSYSTSGSADGGEADTAGQASCLPRPGSRDTGTSPFSQQRSLTSLSVYSLNTL